MKKHKNTTGEELIEVINKNDILQKEKQAGEDAFGENKEMYHALFEQAGDGILILNTSGRIISANKAFADLHGFSIEEILNLGLERINVEGLSSSHDLIRLIMEGKILTFEVKHYHRDGYIFPLSVTANLVSTSKEKFIVAIHRDITGNKRMEEELKKSEERFRAIMNLLPDAVSITDANGNRNYISPADQKIRGFLPEEIIGKNHYSFVHPEDLPIVSEKFKEVVTYPDKTPTVEYRGICKDGSYKWLEARGSNQINNPLIKGVIIVSRDITERKKAENEKEKLIEQIYKNQGMSSLVTLAGGIAHNFNNILSSILGYTELVQWNIPENTDDYENLSKVIKSCGRARDLINQMIAFSRKSICKKKPLILKDVIAEALNLIRASMPPNIEISQKLEDNSSVILADNLQIHQVIINLCINAIQSIKENTGLIDISLNNIQLTQKDTPSFSELKAGPYVKLIVRDNGQGMDSETIKYIFDPFFTTKEVGEGYGLGLSVVYGIVKQHKGDIKVYSEPEKGTAFHIFFPEADRNNKISDTNGEKGRILIVDNDQSMVDLLEKVLKKSGYNVFTATSSIEALEVFLMEPNKFDLIIAAQAIPKMTGKELVKQCLSIRPDIPVIFCTAFSEYIDPREALNMGIKKIIKKPVNIGNFLVIIRNVLDEKEGYHERGT